jgi:hypothetical protein
LLKDARDKSPALRSFLACAGLSMRVPLRGTEPFTAEKILLIVLVCAFLALFTS